MENPSPETKDKEIKKVFYINQSAKIYQLTIILNSNEITLNISNMNKFMQSYQITLNLNQIKEKHDTFSNIKSSQEFLDKIKDSIEKKEIIINKKYDNLISFEFKKNKIIFELIKERIELDKLVENINIMKDKYNMKISDLENKLDRIYNENKYMKNEIDELKKNNKIFLEENKKLKEKINLLKGIRNVMEAKNNKIQDLKDKLFLKEKKKKYEEIKQNEEILKLNKDIQEIKKMISETKIKKDLLRLESLEKNINRININRNKKESLNNYSKDLNKNINNINFNEKEKIEINNIKEHQENSKDDSEINEFSFGERKFSLLKQKEKNKKDNEYITNTPKIFEQNLYKTPQKEFRESLYKNLDKLNDKKMNLNILPHIFNINSNKKNQMLNTQKEFYTKNENYLDKEVQNNENKIMRNTYSENSLFSKNDNKIHKKPILFYQRKLFDDIKKKCNDEKFNTKKIKLKINEDYNDKFKNMIRVPNYKRNFDNINEEKKENSQIHFPKTTNNSKNKDCDFCYLS